jgi:hypothetical protein
MLVTDWFRLAQRGPNCCSGGCRVLLSCFFSSLSRGSTDVKHIFPALLALSLAAPSCQPAVTADGGTAPDDAGQMQDAGGVDASIPVGQFCDDFAVAWCAHEERCGWLDASQKAECLSHVTGDCVSRRALNLSVRAYDETAAGACIQAIRSDSCRLHRGVDPTGVIYGYQAECRDVFATPNAAIGHACATSADCVTGFCAAPSAATCTACLAYLANGQNCQPGASASNTLRCDPKTSFCAPGSNVCTAQLALGAGPCSANTHCDATTGGCGAAPTDGGVRVCVTKQPDGASCTIAQQCTTGHCTLLASGGICGKQLTGQSCLTALDCMGGICRRSAAGGVCAEVRALGSTCTPGDGCMDAGLCLDGTCKLVNESQTLMQECITSVDCTDSLWCARDGGSGRCVTRLADGMPCNTQNACLPGHVCDAATNTCAPIGGPGSPCPTHDSAADNFNCMSFLMCAPNDAGMGTCVPWAMRGDSCKPNAIICNTATDLCVASPEATTCVPYAAEGASCLGSAMCASSRCRTTDGGQASAMNPGTCQRACLP